jgi:hypothetical protein
LNTKRKELKHQSTYYQIEIEKKNGESNKKLRHTLPNIQSFGKLPKIKDSLMSVGGML